MLLCRLGLVKYELAYITFEMCNGSRLETRGPGDRPLVAD